MKKSLYLYLFILSALINVFMYAWFTQEGKAATMKTESQLKKANDSVLVLYNELQDANYFSLEYNQNAQERINDDPKQLSGKIRDKILSMNDSPKGNALVPYDQINGQKFIVNKVKVLNHRWVIADFSDGKVWGEVLLKYFPEENGEITFERMDAQLYMD